MTQNTDVKNIIGSNSGIALNSMLERTIPLTEIRKSKSTPPIQSKSGDEEVMDDVNEEDIVKEIQNQIDNAIDRHANNQDQISSNDINLEDKTDEQIFEELKLDSELEKNALELESKEEESFWKQNKEFLEEYETGIKNGRLPVPKEIKNDLLDKLNSATNKEPTIKELEKELYALMEEDLKTNKEPTTAVSFPKSITRNNIQQQGNTSLNSNATPKNQQKRPTAVAVEQQRQKWANQLKDTKQNGQKVIDNVDQQVRKYANNYQAHTAKNNQTVGTQLEYLKQTNQKHQKKTQTSFEKFCATAKNYFLQIMTKIKEKTLLNFDNLNPFVKTGIVISQVNNFKKRQLFQKQNTQGKSNSR